jgi:hypothetical protein
VEPIYFDGRTPLVRSAVPMHANKSALVIALQANILLVFGI